MSELDDLLAACVAAPDDDAPRLVWADAVGGQRGELVVIQCRLAREGLALAPAEAGALLARQDELLAMHGKAWSGFADVPAVKRCLFRRGFVESIEVDVAKLWWPQLFVTAPLVTALRVKGIDQRIDYTDDGEPAGEDPIVALERVLAAPELGRLRGLEIDDARIVEITGDTEWHYASSSVMDRVLEHVAASGRLAGLRALGLIDEYTARGLHELIGANVLPTIERLRLQYGETTRDQARALFAAAPRLRALDDYAALALADIADLIPASVVELRGIVRGEAGWEALAASPVAEGLQRLGVVGSTALPPGAPLGAFPSLRALAYHAGDAREVAAPSAAELAACALPHLRELRLVAGLAAADVLAIAEAFGPQLARLEVPASDHLPLAELRAKVAGHVAAIPYTSMTDRLLHVGVDPREPWLSDAPVVLRRY